LMSNPNGFFANRSDDPVEGLLFGQLRVLEQDSQIDIRLDIARNEKKQEKREMITDILRC
jgi:hypothetical protein